MSVFENDNVDALARALTLLDTEDEAGRFIEDILTTREIISISQRFAVARLLAAGEKYADIEKATGASSATVVRVNQCMRYGSGGYGKVLKKLEGGGKNG